MRAPPRGIASTLAVEGRPEEASLHGTSEASPRRRRRRRSFDERLPDAREDALDRRRLLDRERRRPAHVQGGRQGAADPRHAEVRGRLGPRAPAHPAAQAEHPRQDGHPARRRHHRHRPQGAHHPAARTLQGRARRRRRVRGQGQHRRPRVQVRARRPAGRRGLQAVVPHPRHLRRGDRPGRERRPRAGRHGGHRSDDARPRMRYGEEVRWEPATPRLRPLSLVVTLIVGAAAVGVAAWLVPGVELKEPASAFAVALAIALLNAILPPLLAALRLPFMLVAGFLLVLVADALVLQIAGDILNDIHVDGFGDALLASLIIAAVSPIITGILGTNDDDEYTLRVTRRIAKRQGAVERTDVPGIIYLEIDGLALPVLRDAMRDGSAPEMARWVADKGYQLTEWETDLSSQTGASQAGILLGSNEDIPAFRWVEKERGMMMVCSSP